VGSRRFRRRVVFKGGDCNVTSSHVAKRRRRYLQDIFTTLVDAQWRWTLLVFAMNFLLSWLGFALMWYAVAASHGDTEIDAFTRPNETCVTNMHTFTSAFLFSFETQHTIGYGSRSVFIFNPCPAFVFLYGTGFLTVTTIRNSVDITHARLNCSNVTKN
jgi:potassium inwardly-rectifying channel subfamily J, other